MYKSMQVRKSASSFFKKMDKIDEVNESADQKNKDPDIKPITQKIHSRTSSLSFLNKKSMDNSFIKEKPEKTKK